MKPKDLILLALITIVSFPLTFVFVMLLTGYARFEFGPKEDLEKTKELATLRHTARRDSLAATHSQLFLALQQERRDLDQEREKLTAQKEHIRIVEQELETAKQEIEKKRAAIEQLTQASSESETKRVRQLSKVYASMRPTEAAQILETLNDRLVANIITNMGDDRQKAKILAALTPEKATKVSKMISK